MFSLNLSDHGVVVLYPGRLIEREDLREIRHQLEQLEAEGSQTIVMDFSETEHVYYRVADLLARHHTSLSRSDRRLMLAGVSPYLKDIFAAVGYVDYFEHVESLADAVRQAHC